MATYQELKSAAYLPQVMAMVQELYSLDFHHYGENKFGSSCPFHNDSKGSFRVHVDGKNEVRFHCFGECKGDWDIYDLIMKRRNCSFREAQQEFARFAGDEYFKAYRSSSPPAEDTPAIPVSLAKPKVLDAEIAGALDAAAFFYHHNLVANPDKHKAVIKFLARRGVSEESISRFSIGYASPFRDAEQEGRGLILSKLESFRTDHLTFLNHSMAGLIRHLDVEDSYYRRYVDYREAWGLCGRYSDYFAGMITFPVRDEQGRIQGFIGRRINNQGSVRWLKQQTQNTSISPRGWLYGIDQAARHIVRHKTVIIVEGIFDYFAFYNILQDQHRPFIVSTLGTALTDETAGVLNELGIDNYVVAYDCDPAGEAAIKKFAAKVHSSVYFLGGMVKGQDPAEHLSKVANSISGFSVKHLMDSARKHQPQSEKPIYVSIISTGAFGLNEVLFKPAESLEDTPTDAASPRPQFCHYNSEDFLPLLRYDHGNKASLAVSLNTIVTALQTPPRSKELKAPTFRIKSDFIGNGFLESLGPALILWLFITIEQQRVKRYVRQPDAALAERLHTSRKTVNRYKGELRELGLLNIDTTSKRQRLSVSIKPRGKDGG